MVIWITGLSAAGKTTLSQALVSLVKDRVPELVVLDGDVVRAAMGHDLGYTEADRHVQIYRLQRLAKALAAQKLVVVVAALYAHPDLLAWNRANLPGYFEVYLKASMQTLVARDPKSLYAKARSGDMQDVVGVHIPWHEPIAPDLVFDVDHAASPAAMARQLAAALPRLHAALLVPTS